MTMEGRYVRIAYNNEGFVTLGYKLANLSVGEEWMLLEVASPSAKACRTMNSSAKRCR